MWELEGIISDETKQLEWIGRDSDLVAMSSLVPSEVKRYRAVLQCVGDCPQDEMPASAVVATHAFKAFRDSSAFSIR
jgi:hypothetical protein